MNRDPLANSSKSQPGLSRVSRAKGIEVDSCQNRRSRARSSEADQLGNAGCPEG
jgi:hypothetical protein